MDSQEFLTGCSSVVEFIIDYLEKLPGEKVSTVVENGFLQKKISPTMEQKGQHISEIITELKTTIMPGVVHWAHPHFHGYLPSSHAFPSILAEMFASSIGAMGFSWLSGPAMAELEVIMTDWLAQSLGLPDSFLNSNENSMGGGIMSSSATECALCTILAARLIAVNLLRDSPGKKPEEEDAHYLQKLVAYSSNEAHSSIEKAARVAVIQLRVLPTNGKQQLDADVLAEAIETDLGLGLRPCYVAITLGTTSSGAFDNLAEIANVVKRYPGIWLHVNAAYGGNNFICPELRTPMQGIQMADSICVNPYKGLLMNIDSTVLWVKNRVAYCSALIVDPVYLAHNLSDQFLDHRHWSLWLSRRFRSLKIWFTFRLYGVNGLRNHVRNMMAMATAFADLVRSDARFEVCNDVLTPLVCFRLRGPNGLNHELLALINGRGTLLLTPALLATKFVLRLAVGYEGTTLKMMQETWKEISAVADDLLSGLDLSLAPEAMFRRLSFTRRVSFMDYRLRNPTGALKEVGEPVLVPVMAENDDISEETDKKITDGDGHDLSEGDS